MCDGIGNGAIARNRSLVVQDLENVAEYIDGLSPVVFDMVHKPKHYMIIPEKDVEVIDVIRASLTEEQFKGYCKGNMIKYLLRDKLDADEDVSKAGAYVKFYTGEIDGQK